ncbi:double zinc ribbon domain-containing protein [Halosimplex pelagicum]|uniref:Zinc ribbon domain-containing protein n=1 Tax=Halosimplex pelagicum TaxID=869886 RepID=A0A7D5T976_9EURY|nr:zinc ribbon domain-containing protein [Halosimplex pelagicum]QLH81650.1 zinc ribbon domain-containing protein [Halosimplex pelagicum]
MSKITFRADDDLIERLEGFDASKSEIMREALREYLGEGTDTRPSATATGSTPTAEASDASESIDDLIAERVDAIVADRLDGAFTPSQPQDINVNIALDGENAPSSRSEADASPAPAAEASGVDPGRKTGADAGENAPDDAERSCGKCGENVSSGHVYCPNCGEKASHRVFCDCGDELRSDWAFCPSCGRRTPAADVLDQS